MHFSLALTVLLPFATAFQSRFHVQNVVEKLEFGNLEAKSKIYAITIDLFESTALVGHQHLIQRVDSGFVSAYSSTATKNASIKSFCGACNIDS